MRVLAITYANCVVLSTFMFYVTCRDAVEFLVPPVIIPSWNRPVPKFNSLIIRKMGNKESPLCSGALISDSFVVTVGQGCVKQRNNRVYSPDDIFTRFISFNDLHYEITIYDKNVKRIVLHEGCCRAGNYMAHNDIALVQLESPVDFDNYIKAARITKRTLLHHPVINENWDLTNIQPHHLSYNFRDAVWFVKTSFIGASICDKIFPTKRYQTLQLTCVSYYHKGGENCSTDQGSPLSYQGELIGLLVHRQYEDCGGPGTIALFVNMGIQSKWIRENVARMSNGAENV